MTSIAQLAGMYTMPLRSGGLPGSSDVFSMPESPLPPSSSLSRMPDFSLPVHNPYQTTSPPFQPHNFALPFTPTPLHDPALPSASQLAHSLLEDPRVLPFCAALTSEQLLHLRNPAHTALRDQCIGLQQALHQAQSVPFYSQMVWLTYT
jgi:hypothetical protein